MSTTSERQPEPTEPAEPTPSWGAPSARPLRQWQIATTNGLVFSGPLTWAHNDPSVSGVAPGAVARELADVMHYAESPGMPATVTSPYAEPLSPGRSAYARADTVTLGAGRTRPRASDPAEGREQPRTSATRTKSQGCDGR